MYRLLVSFPRIIQVLDLHQNMCRLNFGSIRVQHRKDGQSHCGPNRNIFILPLSCITMSLDDTFELYALFAIGGFITGLLVAGAIILPRSVPRQRHNATSVCQIQTMQHYQHISTPHDDPSLPTMVNSSLRIYCESRNSDVQRGQLYGAELPN